MSAPSDTLTNLHDHYVEAINLAVADGDDARVARLAAEFDLEALDAVRRSRLAAASECPSAPGGRVGSSSTTPFTNALPSRSRSRASCPSGKSRRPWPWTDG